MEIKQAYLYLQNALTKIYGAGEASSITRILFEDAFGITNSNRVGDLSVEQRTAFISYVERLLKKEPIQYILGEADFFGLKLKVDKNVLIPRQETEELVAWIIENHRGKTKLSLLDIGTGSGCIPIALKHKMPQMDIWALDISKEALLIAKENAQKYKLEIQWRKVDILAAKNWHTLNKFDVIISNPPYISGKEKNVMPEWVLEYEPHLALFSEENPLLFYDKIGDFALQKLNKNGSLFFELNEFNAPKVSNLLSKKGYRQIEIREDLNGKNRMLLAKR